MLADEKADSELLSLKVNSRFLFSCGLVEREARRTLKSLIPLFSKLFRKQFSLSGLRFSWSALIMDEETHLNFYSAVLGLRILLVEKEDNFSSSLANDCILALDI